jgi:hypothetical protein
MPELHAHNICVMAALLARGLITDCGCLPAHCNKGSCSKTGALEPDTRMKLCPSRAYCRPSRQEGRLLCPAKGQVLGTEQASHKRVAHKKSELHEAILVWDSVCSLGVAV